MMLKQRVVAWMLAVAMGLGMGSSSAQDDQPAPAGEVLQVLDAELSGADAEIEALMARKRLTELRAEIATAQVRLSEAERRARGGGDAAATQRPMLSVIAISNGKAGRTAVLASAAGRVRVRTGDHVGGFEVTAIRRGAVVVTDVEGQAHTLGFGATSAPQQALAQQGAGSPVSILAPTAALSPPDFAQASAPPSAVPPEGEGGPVDPPASSLAAPAPQQ